MSEYSGSLASLEIALALWLAPLVPLLAVLFVLIPRSSSAETTRSRDPLSFALVTALGALALVGMNVGTLLLAPAEQRQLVSHGWTLLRAGSVDVTFTISMTPVTGLAALAVALAACAVLGVARLQLREDEARTRFALGASLALAGVLLVLLGDDWVLMTAGAAITGLSALVLGVSGLGAFGLGRVGDAALLSAGVLLAWALGGDFATGDYLPDFRARIVAVQLGDAPKQPKAPAAERPSTGTLTMAALPGATLVVGGAQLCLSDADGRRGGIGTAGRPCKEPARSPFARLPMAGALQDIEVSAGPGTQDQLVEKVRVSPDRETLLTSAGPTLVLREMRDQLSLRDVSGARPLRGELKKKRLLGQPILGLVGALLGIAVLCRGLLGAFFIGSRPARGLDAGALTLLAGATDLVVAGAILSRADFVLDLLPRTGVLLALVAAAAVLVAAARAAHAMNAKAALLSLATAEMALVILALSAGAREAASALLAVHVLGVTALGLTLATTLHAAEQAGLTAAAEGELPALSGLGRSLPAHVRASSFAATALAGAPLPAVGIFWGRDAALQASLGQESLGVVGWAAALLGLVGSGLIAFAAWRLDYVVFGGAPPRKAKKLGATSWTASVASGLGVLALLLGVLGLTSLAFEGLPTPLESWLRPFGLEREPAAHVDRSVRIAILVAGYAAALVGWFLCRQRYGGERAPKWAESEPARFGHAFLEADGRSLAAVLEEPAERLGSALDRVESALETLAAGPRAEARDVESAEEEA